jgi:hypothetical protein
MPFRRLACSSFRILLLTFVLSATCLAQTFRLVSQSGPHRGIPGGSGGTPVRVSPGDWSQLSKLISGQGLLADNFGISVAISGDTVVVGSLTLGSQEIVAHIFRKSALGWRDTLPIAALRQPSPRTAFGSSVAIDGDTVVVGSGSFDSGIPGVAYVFVRPATGWTNMTPTAILTPSDSMDSDFGQTVSISGNTIVAGDSTFNSSTGEAYVYVKPAAGWANTTETAKLTASDGVPNDNLGASVSIDGSTIAVGAPQINAGTGKAYVFVEPATGWADITQTAELTASDALSNFSVGYSISVGGDNILVGAPSGYYRNSFPGNAYLFTKPSGGWANMTQTAELLPADGKPDDAFGDSVAIAGKTAAVGAPRRGGLPVNLEGGIYVFREPTGGWQNMSGRTVLTGSDARHAAFFGASIGMSGNLLVGGADFFSIPGAAYVFGLP